MNCGHWHYEKCVDCGIGVLTRQNGGHDIICKKCKEKRRAEYEKRRYRYKSIIHPGAYIVINDPDKVGGFPKDAQLSIYEIRYMLKDNCFTVDTLLMNMQGIYYRVKYGENGRQELITI